LFDAPVEDVNKVLDEKFDDMVDSSGGAEETARSEDVPSEDYEPSKMEQTARSMDGMRGHKIMPKGLEKKLPPLYSQDGKGMDATVHAKFFDPQGQATWHLTEYDPKTGDAFGHADMGFGEGEMGYFNVWEIGQTKGKMGLPMERDMYFEPKSLNDAIG